MNKIFLSFCLMLVWFVSQAQTAADYNYSVGLKAYSMMQLPKILNQVDQDNINTYFNGAIVKFNDNQISYRISGTYLKKDITFNNTCATCEIASGTVTDYSFKLGFEKNFTYAVVQPYFAFDLGYRYNRFAGEVKPNMASFDGKTTTAIKNGLVLSPVIGFKVNVLPQLTLFAESNLDFYFSYERQDTTEPDGSSRTVNTYRKLESLLNPISAGLQFNISRKN